MNRIFPLLLCFLSLTACQNHQPVVFKSESLELPEHFYGSGKNISPISKKPWWEHFQDSQLNQLVANALSSSHDITKAKAQLEQAYSAFDIQSTHTLPSLGTNVGLQKIKKKAPNLFTSQNQDTYTQDLSLGLSLNYELDLLNRLSSLEKSSWHQSQASLHLLEQAQLLIAAKVSKAYLNQVLQKKLHTLYNQQLLTHKNMLNLSSLNYLGSSSSSLDLHTQQAAINRHKSLLPQAKQAFIASHHQLALLGATAMDQEPAIFLFSAKFPTLPPIPSTFSPYNLMQSRPDLQAAYETVQAIDQEFAHALALRYPSLSFKLQYQFNGEQTSTLFKHHLLAFSSQILAPIFDRKQIHANIRLKKAKLKEALENLTYAYQQAFVQIEQSLQKEAHLLMQSQHIEKESLSLGKALQEAKEQYAAGLLPYFQVLQILQQTQQNEINQTKLQAEVLSNRVDLYLALGYTSPFKPLTNV